MDSKAVSQHIRSQIWPILRQAGFTRFTTRAAWRERDPWTDQIVFESVGENGSFHLGCASYSFMVRLATTIKGWTNSPQTTCLNTPGSPFRDPPDTSALESLFAEMQTVIRQQALPWFDAFQDLDDFAARLAPPGSAAELGLFAAVEVLRYEAALTTASHARAVAAFANLTSAFMDVMVVHPVCPSPAPRIEINSRLALAARLGLITHAELPAAWHATAGALWPILRQAGFTEFRQRRARRLTPYTIETVELLRPHGEVAFYVQWRLLDPDCHHLGLAPQSVRDLTWFDEIKATDWCALTDTELYLRWPTLSGQGAHHSARRLQLRAALAHSQGEHQAARQLLAEASTAAAARQHWMRDEQPYIAAALQRLA